MKVKVTVCDSIRQRSLIEKHRKREQKQCGCELIAPQHIDEAIDLFSINNYFLNKQPTVATRYSKAENMSQSVGRVIIYGGRGALGAKCVSHFKANNWWVGSIDLGTNDEADLNILVTSNDNLPEQEEKVLTSVSSALSDSKLDAVICVAGGWAGGNAKKDLAKNSDLMWRQSVWSSVISASIAANYLRDGGLLTLTGANAALQETPGMIGYGLAKAAVHHLTKSLAGSNSGLPSDSICVAILPVTLDTPMNRKWMPKADFSTWTPLEFVAELFLKWSTDKDRPANGSLMQLVTKNSKTDVIAA